jgi:hypothetical protein
MKRAKWSRKRNPNNDSLYEDTKGKLLTVAVEGVILTSCVL